MASPRKRKLRKLVRRALHPAWEGASAETETVEPEPVIEAVVEPAPTKKAKAKKFKGE